MSNNNLNRHMMSDKIKWIVTLLAFVLVAVLFAGIFAGWFKVPAPKDETPVQGAGVDGGAVVGPGAETGAETGNRIVLATEQFDLTAMSPEERQDRGISPIAETAYTVTATVSGDGLTADQKNVTWSAAAFKNPSSSWASGKSVATYVTATPSKNTLTVQCLKAFGEQIVVTATSTFNKAVSKQLTVDYKEKIEFTGVTVNSKNMTGTVTETLDITGDRNAAVVGSFSHSDAYTIKGDTVTAVIKFTRSSQLTTAVTSAYATRFPEYTVTVTSASPSGTINDYFDKETHNKIFLDGYPTSFTAANMATVYNGLKTMDTSSQAQYTVAATVTGASSNSSAQQKSLGSLKLNFDEIQTWYEAFSNLSIGFGTHEGGIIF